MANVPETVRTYAGGLEQPRGRVALTARTLREADATLLPHDPVGRNLSTEVLPNHTINLLVGVAVGDPIANVARLVRAYRDARWYQPINEILGEVEPRQPILGGQTLGLDLDGLVDLLARPSELERHWRRVAPKRFRVSLVVGEALLAKVEDLEDGRVDFYKPHDPDAIGGRTFHLLGQERETAPFQRWAHLEFAHFDIAAALWGDSLKHGAVYDPSLLDSSSDGPAEIFAPNKTKHAKALARDEKNAGHPRQGEPAPTSDQPRANETGGLATLPEAICENSDFQGKPRRRQATSSRTKKEPNNA